MYMVFCVLDDPDNLGKVTEALEKGGIRGATIFESTGLHRVQKKHLAMQYLYSPQAMEETENVSLFAIVPDKKAAEDCLVLIESVIGDLCNPYTGIFAAWELDMIKGLRPPEVEDE